MDQERELRELILFRLKRTASDSLKPPRDPAAFIADLQRRHIAALNRLETALRKGTTGGVQITRKKGEPWISVPPLSKQEEPTGLKALKTEISRRWGVIDLLDVLKDVAHVTGYTAAFTSVASRTVTEEAVLQRRLLLCLYGLGTNVGIKRVADGVAGDPAWADKLDQSGRDGWTARRFFHQDMLQPGARVDGRCRPPVYGPYGYGNPAAFAAFEVRAERLHQAYQRTVKAQGGRLWELLRDERGGGPIKPIIGL